MEKLPAEVQVWWPVKLWENMTNKISFLTFCEGFVCLGFFKRKNKFYSVSLQEFLENEQEVLNAVTALTRKIQQREEQIGDINRRLQNKLEGLTSLFDKKSRMDDYLKIH